MKKPITPKITVAAVAEHDGRFLMIEESIRDELVLNQPAGHLENGETLLEAVARECFEESGWLFEPTHICGIYSWQHPIKHITVVRFAFGGKAHSHNPNAVLDDGIERALWMTPQEVNAEPTRLRSPMVMQAIKDTLAGVRYPLELLGEQMHLNDVKIAAAQS